MNAFIMNPKQHQDHDSAINQIKYLCIELEGILTECVRYRMQDAGREDEKSLGWTVLAAQGRGAAGRGARS